MYKKFIQDPWLKLIAGSTAALLLLSIIEFFSSRFNASTMQLEMKMMKGMFLNIFLRDVLNIAIQGAVFFLLIGAGVGMFLFFKRGLQSK
jgi:hypothetical protein